MGIAAALGAAVVWAVASTFMASQTARVDTLSLSFIRAVWAGGFFVVALFALGGVDDLMSMSFHNCGSSHWPGSWRRGWGRRCSRRRLR